MSNMANTTTYLGNSAMKIHVFSGANRVLFGLFAAFGVANLIHADPTLPTRRLTIAIDPTGLMGTYKIDGPIDKTNDFFQSLGTNGRSCSTCHDAA